MRTGLLLPAVGCVVPPNLDPQAEGANRPIELDSIETTPTLTADNHVRLPLQSELEIRFDVRDPDPIALPDDPCPGRQKIWSRVYVDGVDQGPRQATCSVHVSLSVSSPCAASSEAHFAVFVRAADREIGDDRQVAPGGSFDDFAIAVDCVGAM